MGLFLLSMLMSIQNASAVWTYNYVNSVSYNKGWDSENQSYSDFNWEDIHHYDCHSTTSGFYREIDVEIYFGSTIRLDEIRIIFTLESTSDTNIQIRVIYHDDTVGAWYSFDETDSPFTMDEGTHYTTSSIKGIQVYNQVGWWSAHYISFDQVLGANE